ncbi:MAG: RNA polymerase sigma factor [bacterium]|nr:RNA polymerase sigma factor [bacterium]MCM1373472.1 RNA polymerase sigma factor [Muribaculum sp.]
MAELNHQYLAGLVLRFKGQDINAFAELYTLTYNKVYLYARRYLRDEHLAQDAAQEIYIVAYRNINKLSDPTLFVAWLNRISFHVCYDIAQKQNNHYDLAEPELLNLIRDEHPDSNPETLVLHASELQMLHQAMDELPFHERSVLIMRYYNDMKLDEIASAMDLSRSTVKRYIASGRDHLAHKLKG